MNITLVNLNIFIINALNKLYFHCQRMVNKLFFNISMLFILLKKRFHNQDSAFLRHKGCVNTWKRFCCYDTKFAFLRCKVCVSIQKRKSLLTFHRQFTFEKSASNVLIVSEKTLRRQRFCKTYVRFSNSLSILLILAGLM